MIDQTIIDHLFPIFPIFPLYPIPKYSVFDYLLLYFKNDLQENYILNFNLSDLFIKTFIFLKLFHFLFKGQVQVQFQVQVQVPQNLISFHLSSFLFRFLLNQNLSVENSINHENLMNQYHEFDFRYANKHLHL